MTKFDRNTVMITAQAHLVRPGDEYREITMEPPRQPIGEWRTCKSNRIVNGMAEIISTDNHVLSGWPAWRHVEWKAKT